MLQGNMDPTHQTLIPAPGDGALALQLLSGRNVMSDFVYMKCYSSVRLSQEIYLNLYGLSYEHMPKYSPAPINFSNEILWLHHYFLRKRDTII